MAEQVTGQDEYDLDVIRAQVGYDVEGVSDDDLRALVVRACRIHQDGYPLMEPPTSVVVGAVAALSASDPARVAVRVARTAARAARALAHARGVEEGAYVVLGKERWAMLLRQGTAHDDDDRDVGRAGVDEMVTEVGGVGEEGRAWARDVLGVRPATDRTVTSEDVTDAEEQMDADEVTKRARADDGD